ncbi:3-oxoacyl-[acyl-carrier-protein] reductase [Halotydeus destructor]|nr:3-oxoacyl-[acyl-carrier-protein] reductase [Halotydeus destructor]
MTKHAVIFGGTRGIGLATAVKFVQNGFNVSVLSRSKDNVADAVKLLIDGSDHQDLVIRGIQCDIADPDAIEQGFQDLNGLPRMDVLVNCAGINTDNLLIKSTTQGMKDVIDVNLVGAMLTCKRALKIMLRQKSGSIVNVGSIVGLNGNSGQTAYAASKAGLTGFTKSLAKEVGSKGITANVIAPGFVDTEFVSEANTKKIMDRIPLQRLGKAEEIAEAIYFLSSNKYITGQVLIVDGGLHTNL